MYFFCSILLLSDQRKTVLITKLCDGLIMHKDIVSMTIMAQGREREQSYTGAKFLYANEVNVVLLCTAAAAAAKSLQLCLTLCDPIDGSPPGSPVPGILQARTLEWVAISFSNA